ncbi:MAG: Lrp/AsnC ligand binding domain-containing protein [Thaumarchaeota archaeon]|nr:Lrp/AsnC ligand binding domain-containing protein [Nitrososphaerota archaeon]MDE1866834.1 Lrp/AsnC ligand binding domain-containing protein [Nitrososphaerota archaeon]
MEIAFVLVKSKMGHEMEVLNALLKIEGVKEVMGTYGQYDIFAKVQVPTEDQIEKIITKKIRQIPHVVSTTTLPVIPGQGEK